MKCMVLIPCGETPVGHSPGKSARRSQGEQTAGFAGLGGYLAFEADDLKSAIKFAARVQTARVARAAKLRPRSGQG
jgi:hypothetical protein